MKTIKDIDAEYFRLKHNYFDLRNEFKHARRHVQDVDVVIDLAVDFGEAKARYADFKGKYGHLITKEG